MSERSPPDSSDSLRTFLPDGRASTSMPVSSRLSGSVRRSRPVPPGNSVSKSVLEVLRPRRRRPTANTLTISSSMALMILASSRRDSFTSSSWPCEELVALLERLELLEGERVDRAHDPQLALELADPAGRRRCPRPAAGTRRPWPRSGSQSRSRRSASTAVSMRSLVSASSISRRCWRSRSSPSCRSASARSLAQAVELGGHLRGRPRSGGAGARAGRPSSVSTTARRSAT